MRATTRSTPCTASRPPRKKAVQDNNWGVFGRVERDATGKLVASCTRFEHIKYVDSYEDGITHVEAIWALELENL